MKLHVLLLPALLSLAHGLPAGTTFKVPSRPAGQPAPVRNQAATSVRNPPSTQGKTAAPAPAGQPASSGNQATTSRPNNPPSTLGKTRLPTTPSLQSQNNAAITRPDPGAHKDPGEYSESIKNKKFPSLSTPISSKKSAENALKPSLESRAKAALTGHPQPKDKIVAHVKKGNSVTTVVKNPDGNVYSFDRNKGSVGGGIQGEVYNAVNHSSPKTPTVVKETVYGYRPAVQRRGETAEDFKNRVPAKRTKDLKKGYGNLTGWTNKEHNMLKKVGLDAGKPTIVATPNKNVAYLPMKKAEGERMNYALQRGPADPKYVSSHTLVKNAAKAVNYVNRKGVTHNDLNTNNIMVNQRKATLVDFGRAEHREPGDTSNSDKVALYENLDGSKIAPERQLSFDHALEEYRRKEIPEYKPRVWN